MTTVWRGEHRSAAVATESLRTYARLSGVTVPIAAVHCLFCPSMLVDRAEYRGHVKRQHHVSLDRLDEIEAGHVALHLSEPPESERFESALISICNALTLDDAVRIAEAALLSGANEVSEVRLACSNLDE